MLRVESLHGNGITYVKLEGEADRAVPEHLLAEVIREPTVVLDLRGVARVADDGHDAWFAMMAAASAKMVRLLAIECSPAVVDRLNADPGFLGRGEIVSVRTALHCEHCDRATEATIPVDQPVTADDLWFSCAQCDGVLTPKADAATYFAFTHMVPVASLDADMASIVHLATHPGEAEEELGEPLGGDEPAETPEEATAAEAPAEPVTPQARADASASETPAAKPPAPEPARQEKKKGKEKPRAAAAPAQPVDAPAPAPRPLGDEATARSAGPTPVEPTREIPTLPQRPAAAPETTAAPSESLVDTLSVPVPNLGRRDTPPRPSAASSTPDTPASREKTDLNRRAPLDESRLAYLRRRLNEQRPALIAALIGWLWGGALFAILILSGPVGIPAQDLLAFHQALATEELPAAEALLGTHELPAELRTLADQAIVSRREAIRTRLQAEAQAAYDKQAFAEALAKAEKARALAAESADLLFLAADSMRQLGRLPESASVYARFVELAADDPRLDDALFWQGEAALANSKPDEARALFVRVNAMDTSNFKRSAEKRLSELAAAAPPPPAAPPDAP